MTFPSHVLFSSKARACLAFPGPCSAAGHGHWLLTGPQQAPCLHPGRAHFSWFEHPRSAVCLLLPNIELAQNVEKELGVLWRLGVALVRGSLTSQALSWPSKGAPKPKPWRRESRAQWYVTKRKAALGAPPTARAAGVISGFANWADLTQQLLLHAHSPRGAPKPASFYRIP